MSSSTRHDRYDAIVVGARCAGAATAMLLARRGARVLVVDRSAEGADTVSTHGLMRVGVLQLHRWGLLDQIVDADTPPVHHTVFRLGEDVTTIEVEPTPGVPALFAPRRTVLDPILVDAARRAGAHVEFGATVTGLVRDPSTGAVSGVTGRDARRTPFVAHAPITIGADGVRSRVATELGLRPYRRAAASAAFVYSYWEDVRADGYEWCFAPGRAAGVIPTNDSQVCAFVGTPADTFDRSAFQAAPDRWFEQAVRETSTDVADRLADGRRSGRFTIFPGVRGFFRPAHGPGWALVGDAGYFKDPVSAHGISDALRDAELLSDAVSTSDPGSLASYQRMRDELSTELFEITSEIAEFGWTIGELPDLLMAMSRSMKAEVREMSRDLLPAA